MQSPCNCFTLSLSGSNSRRSNSWQDDNHATMEIKVSSRWQDDHGAPKMKINGAIWYWPYHVTIILIACDVYHVFASCLLRTTVVNKMIAHNNFKKVFPLNMHRCEGSLFRSTTWWSGVISSMFTYNGCKPVLHVKNTRVKLDEPSICRYGLGTLRLKDRTWII